MKKWIGLAAILIVCGVYAMVKLSISRYQAANPQVEETPTAKQTGADDANPQVEETPRPKQTKADDTKAATPGENSGTPATAEQVEAATKVFNEFTNAIAHEDYEQAWKLMAESVRSKLSFEEFKKTMADKRASIAKFTIRPGSATIIRGRLIFTITDPSGGMEEDRVGFVQENGQWKLGG